MSIQPKTARACNQLRNLDGSIMDVDDFKDMVRKLQRDLEHSNGQPPAIMDFGYKNTEWWALKVKEQRGREIKKTDFKTIIRNSQIILPSYFKKETGDKLLYTALEANQREFE